MKKQFVILGSNNFWYAIEDSLEDAKKLAKSIKNGDGDYSNPESSYIPDTPDDVYIYEAKQVIY